MGAKHTVSATRPAPSHSTGEETPDKETTTGAAQGLEINARATRTNRESAPSHFSNASSCVFCWQIPANLQCIRCQTPPCGLKDSQGTISCSSCSREGLQQRATVGDLSRNTTYRQEEVAPVLAPTSSSNSDYSELISAALEKVSALVQGRLSVRDEELKGMRHQLEEERRMKQEMQEQLTEARDASVKHEAKNAVLETQLAQNATVLADSHQRILELKSSIEEIGASTSSIDTKIDQINIDTAPSPAARDFSHLVHELQFWKLPSRHAAAPSPAARDFSHLFHDRIEFSTRLPVEQCVPAILASPDVSSVFMLLEGIEEAECVENVGKQQVTAMVQLKQARGWSRVPARFLDSLYLFSVDHPAAGKLVKECRDLVGEGDCIRVTGTPVTNILHLVCKEQVYVFKHPGIVTCDNTSQCGFLVKITPLTRGDPASFKIQLVTDPALYHGAGVHYHDTISVDKMHLVVEWYNESQKEWYNVCASWRGRPEYNEDGDVMWGGYVCSASLEARLVVYYNTTS